MKTCNELRLFQGLLLLFLGLGPLGTVRAADWAHWRGPEQNGSVREQAVVTEWSQDGKNVLWRVPFGGRTTPTILNGRVYFNAPVGDGLGLRERVVCLDGKTGKTLWEYTFNVFHTDIVENRVGWTAPAGDPETGYIFVHGTGGELYCFDKDGKVVWKVSLTEDMGRISGYGGRLMTPIVDEDRVILNFMNSGWGDHAKAMHRYAAFDKRTGQVLWWATPGVQAETPDTTYSNPVVAVIGGIRMLIAGNVDGRVYAMNARTGEALWNYRVSKMPLNASVVADGNFVYAAHGEENLSGTEMGGVACIDATKRGDISESGKVWQINGLEIGYASPAVANGRVYVVDNSSNLFCLDGKTGATQWKYNIGRVGKASPTVTSDGVIYVGDQPGIFHILKDKGSECVSLDSESFSRPDNTIDEIYGSAAVVDGRVYFMTRYNTFCLGIEGAKVSVKEASAPSEIAGSPGIKTIRVSPSEVTLEPGKKVQFKVTAFNDAGRSVPAEKVEWTVSGTKGVVDAEGNFTADAAKAFSAGLVTAKSGDLKSEARVRIGPSLPWTEDFESMPIDGTPPGWVGVIRKTKVVERDGSKVLQKLAENPAAPFLRIRGFMSPSIAGGYTVQADMLGTPKGERFMPDMGLINSRYEMTLMGVNKNLRLETWTPIPRVRHDVPFDWKTGVWYRMKFQVSLEGSQAKLRGKVWPRDETEPAAWTIEFTDPYPNQEGSPGLYAFSPGTTPKSKGPEVFFDNVQVKKND